MQLKKFDYNIFYRHFAISCAKNAFLFHRTVVLKFIDSLSRARLTFSVNFPGVLQFAFGVGNAHVYYAAGMKRCVLLI